MIKLSDLAVTSDEDGNIYVNLKDQPTFTTRVLVPGGADVQLIIDTAEKHFGQRHPAELFVDARSAVTQVNSSLASGIRNARRPDSINRMRVAADALNALADALS
jgi:hypothetical protein